MKKVLGIFLILLSLPLFAWSIYVEFVFLGEAKVKFTAMMETTAQKYSESKVDTEKWYKEKKENITNNYKEQISALDGQAKLEFEKQFKEMEKIFDDTYIETVNLQEETYEKMRTDMRNAFNERVSKEREASYSMQSGILGIIFIVTGVFFIVRGRKKLPTA